MRSIDEKTSQDISDRTSDLLCLADVHRWGVIKTARNQSVAEHSFNVMVIATELLWRLGLYSGDGADGEEEYTALAATLMWAMVHDLPEVLTGDIDGKFKRDYPSVRAAVCEAENTSFPWYGTFAQAMSPRINAIVKCADKIEAITWIKQWGVGARADDVYRELVWIIDNDTVPKLALVVKVDIDTVAEIVHLIANRSCSEGNCIQMRRHRVNG